MRALRLRRSSAADGRAGVVPTSGGPSRPSPEPWRIALQSLVLAVVLSGCGSGESGPHRLPPGLDLPLLGTVGRAPGGEATIVVDVDAAGRISVEGQGPLGLTSLGRELERRTADPRWREPGLSSRKILLLNADASLPWVVPCWVMQAAAGPTVMIYRVFLGARTSDAGPPGAIGWTLPKDRGYGDAWLGPPWLTLRLLTHDGPASAPEAMLPALRRAAGNRPIEQVVIDIGVHARGGVAVPTGYVARVVDLLLRAGVRQIRFQGALPPSPSATDPNRRFDPDDVDALLACVARLKATPGEPAMQVGDETLGGLPPGETVPAAKGRLAILYGAAVEEVEPGPGAPSDVPTDPVGDAGFGEEVTEVVPEDQVEVDDELPPGPPPPATLPARAPGGGKQTTDPVTHALRWLAAHQSPSGGWEAAGFGGWCDGKPVAQGPDGAGDPAHDVGVTGLALCAFLGAGYTNRGQHEFAKVVGRGLRYLRDAQDAEGCFGRRTGSRWIFDHAIATLAMLEACRHTGSFLYRSWGQKALDFIALARNPYLAWRYGVKPGDNDTAVTGWMVMALSSARQSNDDDARSGHPPRFTIDPDALDGARAWIEQMTDPETGRTGYDRRGGLPSRSSDPAGRFPADRSESMTAVGILVRMLLLEDPTKSDAIRRGALLCASRLPAQDSADCSIDACYWYHGTLAMYDVGGASWKAWSDAMKAAIIDRQRKDGDPCTFLGSWDPIDPWGEDGGRVYVTALLAMCLEIYYRYDRTFRVR